MKLIGYGDYNWEADGYWFEMPNAFLPTVQIDPSVIPRPGTSATFGMSVIGAMTFPGSFGYTSPTLAIEDAYLALFTRLDPLNQEPRQLRAQRNDLSIVAVDAVMRIPSSTTDEETNTFPAHFVAVSPHWKPLTPLTYAETF